MLRHCLQFLLPVSVWAADAKLDHWSFQPLREVALPSVKDGTWPRNGIDYFIQAKREAAGLTPCADATAPVLERRLHYALTGLPPQENLSTSTLSLIDTLLAAPAYGERWARHWMDWVRYADTAGDNSDYPIPQAYLYRKYLIESFNADLPYDRFLTEQLAGDLLPAATQAEKNRQTIATGYLAMARRFGSLVERYPWHLTIEDTIDNLGRTVLGLTISCARCHDHKFDPISARDYYGLYGILASTRYPIPGLELFKAQHDFPPLLSPAEAAKKLKPSAKQTKKLNAELQRLQAEAALKSQANAKIAGPIERQRQVNEELVALLRQVRNAGEALSDHLKRLPAIPTAYAVQEAKPINAKIQIKGEPDQLAEEVPRKFPDVLGGQTLSPGAAKTSGRVQLAEWITDQRNPLTARVIVNRIWQRHFGRGLVPTTSDFGIRGEPPSHPELLDWLALDFIRHGWSLKHLHRRILSSRTYQMASADNAENHASDPANTLYWKFPRQRLDAESLRDTLLLLAGNLDQTPQTKPYPFPPMREWKYTQHHPFKDDYPSQKRSVYQMTKRLTVAPYLQTFDGADPNACTAKRDSSVTALQALYFVNDTFVHDQAQLLAKRLMKQVPAEDARLTHAFRLVLHRAPTDEEKALLLDHFRSIQAQTKDPTAAWASVTRTLFRLNEFLYLD